MRFAVHGGTSDTEAWQRIETDCLVAGIWSDDAALPATLAAIDSASDGVLTRLQEAGDLPTTPGTTLMLHHVHGLSPRRLLLVGQGARTTCDAGTFLKSARAAALALARSRSVDAAWMLSSGLPDRFARDVALRLSVQSIHEACYRFDHYRKVDENALPRLEQVSFVLDEAPCDDDALCIADAQTVAEAVAYTRELGDTPPNVCTPGYLAEAARELGRQWPLAVDVLDRGELEALGMQAFLAVARGSAESPKLIVLRHEGAAADQAPIVLVGKGVTFDAGGISIKPAAAMDEMKYDMCGAATVLGVLRACAGMKLPLNVVGIIAACENMPSGSALRPGDVVGSMSGKRIEVLNTDAEGRLILGDAMTYAERFKPAAVVDIATLTGACIVALGHVNSGLYANRDALADELLLAAKEAHDPAWRMPMDDAYQERVDSGLADVANIGRGRDAGSILAACFLSRFATYPWAHLDIAGTAWTSGKSVGATGRPVPLLMRFLMNRAVGSAR